MARSWRISSPALLAHLQKIRAGDLEVKVSDGDFEMMISGRVDQMDDDGDLHEQILHIEARMEELTDTAERCRKIILISKAAIAAGGIFILATIIGAVGRSDATVLVGAIAAVIGGTVVFGSNKSTLKQTLTDMKAAEAHRTELISRIDLKVVGDAEVEN